MVVVDEIVVMMIVVVMAVAAVVAGADHVVVALNGSGRRSLSRYQGSPSTKFAVAEALVEGEEALLASSEDIHWDKNLPEVEWAAGTGRP